MGKGQLSSQPFIYILGFIIVAGILIIGYRQISQASDAISQTEIITLEHSLKNDVAQISKEYGSFKKRTYDLSGTIGLCIADSSRKEAILGTELINLHPLIKDSIRSDTGNNAFFINKKTGGLVRQFPIGEIEISHYPYFVCSPISLDHFELGMEGKGDKALIITNFIASASLAGAEAEIILASPDNMLSLSIPPQTEARGPSGQVQEISIELVEKPASLGLADQASEIYHFNPSGTTFSNPLTLTRKYDSTKVGECPLSLTWFQHADDGSLKKRIPAKEINCETHTASFEIDSFSYGYIGGSDGEDALASQSQALASQREFDAFISQSKNMTRPGEQFTISWGSNGARECIITKEIENSSVKADDFSHWGNGTKGSRMAAPTVEGFHKWTIICTDAHGQIISKSLRHEVAAAVEATIEQSEKRTLIGEQFTVSWKSRNAKDCLVTKFILEGEKGTTIDKSLNDNPDFKNWGRGSMGSRAASPAVVGLHVWNLECTGITGQKGKSSIEHIVYKKNVFDKVLDIVLFRESEASSSLSSSQPTAVLSQSSDVTYQGEQFTISWNSTGFQDCLVTKHIEGRADLNTNPDFSNWGRGPAGSREAAPGVAGSHAWNLRCTLNGSNAINRSLTHQVLEIPQAFLSQSKDITMPGENFTINWSSSGAADCLVSKAIEGRPDLTTQDFNNWGSGPFGSRIAAPGVAGAHIWNVICTAPDGRRSENSSLRHRVVDSPKPTAELSQSKRYTFAGESFVVKWSSLGAVDCTVTKSIEGRPDLNSNQDFLNWGKGASGSREAAPGVIGIHKWNIRCTGADGQMGEGSELTHYVYGSEAIASNFQY